MTDTEAPEATEIADDYQQAVDAEYAKPRGKKRRVLPAVTAALAGLAVAVAGVGVGISAHTAAQTQQTQEAVEAVEARVAGQAGDLAVAAYGADPRVRISTHHDPSIPRAPRAMVAAENLRPGDRVVARGITPSDPEWTRDAALPDTWVADVEVWHRNSGSLTHQRVEVWGGDIEDLPADFEVTIYRTDEAVDRLVMGEGA